MLCLPVKFLPTSNVNYSKHNTVASWSIYRFCQDFLYKIWALKVFSHLQSKVQWRVSLCLLLFYDIFIKTGSRIFLSFLLVRLFVFYQRQQIVFYSLPNMEITFYVKYFLTFIFCLQIALFDFGATEQHQKSKQKQSEI